MTLEYSSPYKKNQLYQNHLQVIQGINFTNREIDIISGIINNRGNKKIADLLLIAPKTIATHIHNVMQKTGYHSRDQIIDFVNHSGKSKYLKQYYTHLLINSAFITKLRKIARLINRQTIICLIYSADFDQKEQNILLDLASYLKISNIILQIRKSEYLLTNEKNFYFFNSTHIPARKHLPFNNIILNFKHYPDQQKNHNLTYIDLSTDEKYYITILSLIEKVLQVPELTKLKQEFLNEEKDLLDLPASVQERHIDKKSNKKGLVTMFLLIFLIGSYYAYQYLSDQVSINHSSTIKTWNLPKQSHIFIGREKLLSSLDDKLHHISPTKHTHTLAISAYTGLGGIGKTQLALQYVHHTKHPYYFKIWLHAENPDNLYKQYMELAKSLGANESEYNKETIVNYMKNWFINNPGWLLVYDNVTDYQEIAQFIPKSGGDVILTSRNRNWPQEFEVIDVNVMTEEEAVKTILFLANININAEEPATKELVKILGYLPLALAQAGAYIKQNNITVEEYLKLYKKYEIKLLADHITTEITAHDPVAVTWNISLEAIIKQAMNNNEQPIAIELLTVCGYLSPDKISRKLLLAWLKDTYSDLPTPDLLLNRHINLLWQYSMINYNDDNHISVHRLVQTVLRDQFKRALETGSSMSNSLNLQWFESLLKFFIENETDFKLTASFQQLLEIRNEFTAKFKNKYNDTLAELDLIISSTYFYQERYDDFLNLLDNVNKYLENNNGSKFLKCKILYLYSAYYRKQGDFVEAQNKLNQSLIIFNDIKDNNDIKSKNLKNLKAKILFNHANTTVAKNKKMDKINRDLIEIASAIAFSKESIELFNNINNTRDWLRSIELYGRLLVLTDQGSEIIKEFDKHRLLLEEIADDRTKMLFDLTYSDAYVINEDFETALNYCNNARKIAERLNLTNELNNITNKEKFINNIILSTTTENN